MTLTPPTTPEERAQVVAAAADEARALNLVIINVGKLMPFCGYFVICEGRSPLHNETVVDRVEELLREIGMRPHHREGGRRTAARVQRNRSAFLRSRATVGGGPAARGELARTPGRGRLGPMEPTGLSPEQEDEFDKVVERVARALHFGRLDEAKTGVGRLIELSPHSTTAYELQGDVLTALRQTEAARMAYHRALEMEPANADAERKFAELSLQDGKKSWSVEALLAGDMDKVGGASHKGPAGAALRSLVFPGLGQLYNGDFELGVILAAVGLGLLGAVLALLGGPLMDAAIGLRLGHAPAHGASAGANVWGWIATVAYTGVYAYSIYEAYVSVKAAEKSGPRSLR
jgi:hypothetical protein